MAGLKGDRKKLFGEAAELKSEDTKLQGNRVGVTSEPLPRTDENFLKDLAADKKEEAPLVKVEPEVRVRTTGEYMPPPAKEESSGGGWGMNIGGLIGVAISIVIGIAMIPVITETVNTATTNEAMPSSVASLVSLLPIIFIAILIVGAIGFIAYRGSGD